MPILYSGTRGCDKATGCEAILRGLAPDGGLYVPDSLPSFSLSCIQDMASLSYAQCAAQILSPFFEQIGSDALLAMCRDAGKRFETNDEAPLRHMTKDVSLMELYHGPTLAFKDVALTLLPHLMTASAQFLGLDREILLITATSGDTGKAAMEGFRDVPGTRCVVFYPESGVSTMQRLQMTTQIGKNVHVIAVRGNFDNAQSGVKQMFASPSLRDELARQGRVPSAANSINFGRLAPQIVYYFTAYAALLRDGRITLGQKVNFVTPTGNFGDILAGWYAKRMGLPIHQLICASNSNHVLSDFFATGIYDANRSFQTTTSPSMDILVSSNLERLLYACTDGDAQRVQKWMSQLTASRRFQVEEDVRRRLNEDIWAGWADENCVRWEIIRRFQENGILIDPHTAVGSGVLHSYREQTGDDSYTVLLSTASPFKFARTVASALLPYVSGNDFDLCAKLAHMCRIRLPHAISDLETMPIRHSAVCAPGEMESALLSALPPV